MKKKKEQKRITLATLAVSIAQIDNKITDLKSEVVQGFARVDRDIEELAVTTSNNFRRVYDRFDATDQKIEQVRFELKSDISEVRKELKKDISEVRSDLKENITHIDKRLVAVE
ncbi:MAG: hypothetical protein RJB39_186 [Candidatus Parcubacteria bacterium]|jgi:predicted  nucleic acid-binding Zn-ribbon protein